MTLPLGLDMLQPSTPPRRLAVRLLLMIIGLKGPKRGVARFGRVNELAR